LPEPEINLERGREPAGGDQADPAERRVGQHVDAHQAALHALQKLRHVGDLLQGFGRSGRRHFRAH
jgi:hypothetical protein